MGYGGEVGYKSDASGDLSPVTGGIIQCGCRYHDPDIGRFLQMDGLVGNPDRYAYCGDDPANTVDPSGEIFGIDDAIIATILLVALVIVVLGPPIANIVWGCTAPAQSPGCVIVAGDGGSGGEGGSDEDGLPHHTEPLETLPPFIPIWEEGTLGGIGLVTSGTLPVRPTQGPRNSGGPIRNNGRGGQGGWNDPPPVWEGKGLDRFGNGCEPSGPDPEGRAATLLT